MSSDAIHSIDSDNTNSDVEDHDIERRIEDRVRYRQVHNNRSASTIKLVRPSSTHSTHNATTGTGANTMDDFQRLKQQRAQLRRNNANLFDGSNSPQNISTYGFLLGIICGGGIVFAMICEPKWEIPQFGLFLAALALFHFLEYLATALFNPDTLTLDCKLYLHGQGMKKKGDQRVAKMFNA